MLPEMCAQSCDHQLDLYAIGRLPEAEAALLEEHLLICEACSQRLAETDRFIAALRSANAVLDSHAPAVRKPVAMSWTRLRYGPVLAAFAAAALFVLAFAPDMPLGRK